MKNAELSLKNPPRHACRGGFTLLELIVVIFIVSLVAAVVLPSFANFGDSRLKSEAREMASVLRFMHDSAVSRKKTMVMNFDLESNLVSWKGVEGEKTKDFEYITSVQTQSGGTVSKGELTFFFGPSGISENISVHMNSGKTDMSITLNHISGKVKIKEEG
jgi:general secretion pathway protein H